MMRFTSLTDKSPDSFVQADEQAVMQAFLTGTPVH